MKRDFPFPIPFGWFQIAYSDELAVGEVKPLRYFGRELVLFRTEDGSAHVFDAYCPHLGAHLGYGGKVVGDTVRCPFHGWRYDATGQCVDVPYAKRIPAAARMKTYASLEKSGLIMAWYHPIDAPPAWDIPEIPEFASDEWTTPLRREWVVRSRNQELAENTVDQAHFRYVHGTNTVASTEFETDGPLLHVVSKSNVATPRGEAAGTIEINTFGFGFGMTRFTGVVETLVVTSGTPVDDEHVHMHLNLAVRKLDDEKATSNVGKAFIAEIERQFSQDIPIWENKVHLARPALCDGDGPIAELRRWAKQFYVETPAQR